MGAGICAMHYTGMAALDMAPGIVWDPWLVAASAAIAVAASAAALWIFFWLRSFAGWRNLLYQAGAALVMGLAICGMHYTGMAAANFPTDSVCLSADGIGGDKLGVLVSLSTLELLAMTLFTSTLDAHMRGTLSRANVQLQSANEELRRRAFLDPLTSLPNRLLLEDRLTDAQRRHERSEEGIAQRHAARIAVLFINLDGFKPVDDSFGHAAGDMLLKETAARLRGVARESDTVARIGRDEFMMLVEDATSVADAVSLARRVLEAVARPVDIAGRQVEISGSIGIVGHPDHGHRDKLIANADAAMYSAKRAGGNTYAVFESHMDAGALNQLDLHLDLRHAVEQGQLRLHYQPKVNVKLGRIRGVAALLRWQHLERGLLAPDAFIPLAERFGLIGRLGQWVLDETCRQIGAWRDEGVRMRVAINLSAHRLREDDPVERIGHALARYRVDPSQLLCEITESVAMSDVKATRRTLDGLARLGVFLSIDYLGTGYSSLSYLRTLPARQLKIDRSFVADIETSADARAIVSAVVHLAHDLSLSAVAEGVGTHLQREILLDLGCDELQGYLFAKPMPAHMILAWAAGPKPVGAVAFSPSVIGEE